MQGSLKLLDIRTLGWPFISNTKTTTFLLHGGLKGADIKKRYANLIGAALCKQPDFVNFKPN